MLAEALSEEGYDLKPAACGQDALDLISRRRFDVALMDIRLPDLDGMQLLEIVLQRHPATSVLLMTGQASVEAAVNAMKKGAYDYLAKPFRIDLLLLKIERLMQLKSLEVENRVLRKGGDVVMVGGSTPLRRVLGVLANVANTDTTVLILGETGTGKELAARLLHQQSHRSRGPLVCLNCGAIPPGLLESELFGYEKGAFTSAHQRHKGLMEQADGGTLFLDEVGEIPLAMQVKLLRALEERSIYRLGGEKEIPVDFRLVAATNRSLDELRREGAIRDDFFYRLNVVSVTLPALRDRLDDLPLLVSHFIRKISSISQLPPISVAPEALEKLMKHRWSGNIRELENLVEQLQVLHPGKRITPRELPVDCAPAQTVNDLLHCFRTDLTLREATVDFEARFIQRVLEEENGNRSAAAQRLGISRKNLWEKLTR
jgi:DNA-binding NtrC family response regulator